MPVGTLTLLPLKVLYKTDDLKCVKLMTCLFQGNLTQSGIFTQVLKKVDLLSACPPQFSVLGV